MSPPTRTIALLLMTVVLARSAMAEGPGVMPSDFAFAYPAMEVTPATNSDSDRLWMLSTRHLTSSSCQVNLEQPNFRASQLDPCWNSHPVTLEEMESHFDPSRTLVIYVHGNRMEACDLLRRARSVYNSVRTCRGKQGVDWLVFSWPSEKEGLLLSDFREKAGRTNAQGLYLSWFLRRQAMRGISVVMIGYSYGARVVTGSLHALAGGQLGGRALSGETLTGADVRTGFIAPAIGSNWLVPTGFHGRATQNLDKLVLLYNRRDAVLKRYWCLDKMRNQKALGFTGPRYFGPRADGTPLKVYSRDCSVSVGLHHVELDYYNRSKGNAQREMGSLVDDRLH